MTQMITQPELIKHIRLLNPNVLRYPGGNLSNMFFWNAKLKILPADVPNPLYVGANRKYSDNFWYGKNTRAKTLSIDNYYKILEQTNSTGIICVNYAYARYGTGSEPVRTAAKLAADWVRYDNGRTKFWEIGNENYGKWQSGYEIDIKNNKDGQPEIISGEAGIVVVNRGKKEQAAEISINDFKYGDRCYIYSLTGGDDNGEFSQKVFINGSGPDNLTGGPVNNLQNIKALSQKINDGIKLVLPPWSVYFLLVEDPNK